MSIFLVILFFYPIAVFAEDICKVSPYEKCPRPFKSNFESFQTAQDVKDMCPKVLNYMDCLGNYDETCEDKRPRKVFHDEGEFESIRAVIADLCDESSLIHTVVTENIECLRNGLFNDDNNTCYENKVQLAQNLIASETEKGSGDDSRPYTPSEACFLQLYDMTCYVDYVAKNCGTLAKDAVIEVFDRFYILIKYCHPDGAVELAEDLGKIRKLEDSFKDIMLEFTKLILEKKDIILHD